MEYFAHPIGHDGHRQPPYVIVAECDSLAIDQVKKMMNGLPMELWQGSRMVGWFQHTSQGFAAVTPPQAPGVPA